MRCPKCGGKRLTKTGKQWSHGKRVQRWRCQNCGRITIYPRKGIGGKG